MLIRKRFYGITIQFCMFVFFTFLIFTIKLSVFHLNKIMRDQRGDQENLGQLKQRQKDLEVRKADLGEQRQQYIQRIEQCDEYIRWL